MNKELQENILRLSGQPSGKDYPEYIVVNEIPSSKRWVLDVITIMNMKYPEDIINDTICSIEQEKIDSIIYEYTDVQTDTILDWIEEYDTNQLNELNITTRKDYKNTEIFDNIYNHSKECCIHNSTLNQFGLDRLVSLRLQILDSVLSEMN